MIKLIAVIVRQLPIGKYFIDILIMALITQFVKIVLSYAVRSAEHIINSEYKTYEQNNQQNMPEIYFFAVKSGSGKGCQTINNSYAYILYISQAEIFRSSINKKIDK